MQTATNPETGEKVAFVGGQWKPVSQTATGPGGRKAFLVGSEWVQDDAPAPVAAIPEGPSDTRVALNASSKAIAGIPDALLNTPTRIWNLLKAGAGTAATAAGRPDLAPDLSPEPDYARRALTALGAINPAAEPTNTRQRVIDAATQGATGMMINPANTARQVVGNAATGTLGGTAAGVTKEVTGSDEASIIAAMVTPRAVQAAGGAGRAAVADAIVKKGQSEVSDKVLADARKEGYVAPPASTNPTFLNNRLESMAGKAAIKQEAGQRNQTITNAVAARDLGMPPDTAITAGKLDAYRKAEAGPYREVAALSRNAKVYLEQLQQARVDANEWWKFYASGTGGPNAKAKAEALQQQAGALEVKIEGIAQRAGKPDLVNNLREARQKIAKSWDIDRALNLGDATVSAPTIGRAYDKGAPFTGGLETIAKFAEGPGRQFVTEGSRIPAPGVSGTEIYGMSGMGAAGSAAAGPAGWLAGGLPLLRGPVRSLLLSDAYQNRFGKPNRDPSKTARAASNIPQQDALIQAILMGRTMAERE